MTKYFSLATDNLKAYIATQLKYIIEQNYLTPFLKNMRSTFSTKIFVMAANIFSGILTARLLGPGGKGSYSVALAVSTTAVFISLLGLNTSNTFNSAKSKESIPNYISNNFIFCILVGFFTATLIFLINTYFPQIIFINDKVLLILCVLWIPLSLYTFLSQGIQLGLSKIKTFNLIEISAPITTIIAIGILLLNKFYSVRLFFLCAFIGQVISFVLSYYYLRPFTKNLFKLFSWSILKQNLSYGIKSLYLPSIFLLLLTNIDLLMVQYYLGNSHAGYYSIATAITGLLMVLPGVTSTLLFAKISSLQNIAEGWMLTNKVIQWQTAIMSILISLTILFVKPVLTLVFGKLYIPSLPAIYCLLPAVFFYSLILLYFNFIAAIGYGHMNIYSTAFALVLNVFLNLKLIPTYGIIGASYSASISYLILFLILLNTKAFINEPDQKLKSRGIL